MTAAQIVMGAIAVSAYTGTVALWSAYLGRRGWVRRSDFPTFAELDELRMERDQWRDHFTLARMQCMAAEDKIRAFEGRRTLVSSRI